jgi:glutathione S-transferase
VVLLSIDPQRLAAAGLKLRSEPAPGTGELFPHLYGALPLEAVLLAQPFTA